jgi:hypothetical protein
MLQHPEFKASTGWLDKFKKRHNILSKSNIQEAGLVDAEVVSDWTDSTLLDLLRFYDKKDVFQNDHYSI